jgi:hypothetical protein
MLALLAITENYGSLHKMNFAVKAESFSNTFFMPKPTSSDDDEEKPSVINRSNLNNGSISNKRKSIRRNNNGSVSRKMF